MNFSLKSLILPLVLSGSVILFSCGGTNEEEATESDSLATNQPAENSIMDQQMIGIPSPSDMLSFIRMTTKGVSNKDLSFLNSTENLKNYRDAKSMALNFGIYSCDLSYCSIFDNSTAAQEYFKSVKSLAQEVGVSSVITPELMKRTEANLKSTDSLVAIADELYYSTSDILERNGKGPTLALIIAGGYIETLNIAANIIQFDTKNPALNRFADQKYVIEDILMYMKKFESDPSVADCIKKIEGLGVAFNQIKETKVEAPSEKEKGKMKVFGGGTVLEMSKEQFDAISAKIKEIRNDFAQIK